MRLGIPSLIYMVAIQPLTVYWLLRRFADHLASPSPPKPISLISSVAAFWRFGPDVRGGEDMMLARRFENVGFSRHKNGDRVLTCRQ